MSKNKYIGHISISIILIIAFIAITILFSTLFKVTSENLHTQATVELGALEPGKSDRTEPVGTECPGGTVFADVGNVGNFGIPYGFFCVEHHATVIATNYFSASEFQKEISRLNEVRYTKAITPPVLLKDWENQKGYDTGLAIVPGHSAQHINIRDYYKSIPGYTLGRHESSASIRSNTFYECTGDHRELSPKMAYIITSGSNDVEKQYAIWSDPNENIGALEPGGELGVESDAYADYDKKVRER